MNSWLVTTLSSDGPDWGGVILPERYFDREKWRRKLEDRRREGRMRKGLTRQGLYMDGHLSTEGLREGVWRKGFTTPIGVKYAEKETENVLKKEEKTQKEGYIAGDKMEPYPGGRTESSRDEHKYRRRKGKGKEPS